MGKDNEFDECLNEKLLQEAKSGNEDSLAELLFQLSPQLRSFCNSLIDPKWQSLISADDIMQESFTEIFVSMSAFRGNSMAEFASWAKRVCKNNYLDAEKGLRAKKRGGGKVRKLNMEDSMMHLFDVACEDDSPLLSLSKQESLKRLAAAIRDLPTDYAAVLIAIDLEGKSVSDFARELEESEGAIYMRRSRALRELRKNLGSSMEF